ncbi:MAG: hypothetical protein K2N24_09580 [Lachnospiraceae bacterium]|nr:hypothetical protein [Lachnospiraceae bacterium]
MDITLKLATILSVNDALKQVIDDEAVTDVALKFKLLTIAKTLENPVAHFELLRNEKIKEFGQEDAQGTIAIDITDSTAMQSFREAMETLMDAEVTLSLTKLKSQEVFNKGLSPEALVGLYEIMEE